MDDSIWDSIKSTVAGAAPLLGSMLGGPAGGTAGTLIADALGVEEKPEAIEQALQQDPKAAAKLRQVEIENRTELRRAKIEADTHDLATINKTIRAEAASNDAYVRRWRPTYGYCTAVTWVLQSAAIVAAIVAAAFFYPESAGQILGGVASLMGALVTMWGIALSILGINIRQRSQDKETAAGHAPQAGILAGLAKQLAGGNKGGA